MAAFGWRVDAENIRVFVSKEFAAFPRTEKGLYCSPLFDMFIQYQYKEKLHQSGKAPIEAISNL
ncbi:hypothetical protein Lal_00012540 [Lupinus albus]|nr:hypothetical protein Lal_00012540 [Lupinus albus]